MQMQGGLAATRRLAESWTDTDVPPSAWSTRRRRTGPAWASATSARMAGCWGGAAKLVNRFPTIASIGVFTISQKRRLQKRMYPPRSMVRAPSFIASMMTR